MVAQGLVDNAVGRPFHILVPNFVERTIHVPKHMPIEVWTEPPGKVVYIGTDTQLKGSHEEEKDGLGK